MILMLSSLRGAEGDAAIHGPRLRQVAMAVHGLLRFARNDGKGQVQPGSSPFTYFINVVWKCRTRLS